MKNILNKIAPMVATRVTMGRNALDGRVCAGISVQSFLNSLFEAEKCPAPGGFAFWSSPDGARWLFVERDLVNREAIYVVATGNMGAEGESVTLKAMASVQDENDKKLYAIGAFFLDTGDVIEGSITVEKKVDELAFTSHVQPPRWANAPRFNSVRENNRSDAVRPSDGMLGDASEDEAEKEPEADTEKDEGDAGSQQGEDEGEGGDGGEMLQTSDDAPEDDDGEDIMDLVGKDRPLSGADKFGDANVAGGN